MIIIKNYLVFRLQSQLISKMTILTMLNSQTMNLIFGHHLMLQERLMKMEIEHGFTLVLKDH